eukprot:GHVQ01033026.1.p1 GENE.GHVQ01033026.1~~GHVQ01033026.1.p1  ORF type:complete len:118 (-),score=8.38 GHVQ01033026.1:312-665(-)
MGRKHPHKRRAHTLRCSNTSWRISTLGNTKEARSSGAIGTPVEVELSDIILAIMELAKVSQSLICEFLNNTNPYPSSVPTVNSYVETKQSRIIRKEETIRKTLLETNDREANKQIPK